MDSPPKKSLIFYIKMNQRIIEMQLDGLSHSESLIQPPFRGNCLNWVLGHILTGRDSMFKELGLPGELTPEQYARYDRESDPITSTEDAAQMDDLRVMLIRSAQRLTAQIGSMDMAMLNHTQAEHENRTLGSVLAFSIWHETYHVGQLELLRQLSGKDDKII